jgi:hypothetical protein
VKPSRLVDISRRICSPGREILIVTVTQLRAPVLTLILLLAEMYMTDREANFQ